MKKKLHGSVPLSTTICIVVLGANARHTCAATSLMYQTSSTITVHARHTTRIRQRHDTNSKRSRCGLDTSSGTTRACAADATRHHRSCNGVRRVPSLLNVHRLVHFHRGRRSASMMYGAGALRGVDACILFWMHSAHAACPCAHPHEMLLATRVAGLLAWRM